MLLFIIYPTGMQQLVPEKFKTLCCCSGHFFFLQHCPIEIVLTHGAWGLLLLRRIFSYGKLMFQIASWQERKEK